MKRLIALLCLGAVPVFALAQPAACACSGDRVPVTCSGNQPDGCKVKVEVKVVDGRCEVTLPYCLLCVRRKDNSGGTDSPPTVTWELTTMPAGAAAAFRSNPGIDIIGVPALKPDFVAPRISLDKQRFSWTATKENSTAARDHTAQIFPVPPGPLCTSPGAKIVNTDQ